MSCTDVHLKVSHESSHLAFILFFLYKFVFQMGVNRFSKNGYNRTSKIEV
jgi:hypothetical protein